MYDICVVGFGAIGAIYSLALERSREARVTAVCRSNYRVLTEHGLDIDSEKFGQLSNWRPHRVVATPEQAADRPYDFVICCFKALPDVLPTPSLLSPLLGKTSTFILLQNGIGIERDLRAAAPDATIISGCAWIDTTVVDGSRRVTHSSLERLTLGIHHSTQVGGEVAAQVRELVRRDQLVTASEDALARFAKLLRDGGASPIPTGNIDAERWRKVLWNASYSTLCTITRASVPALLKREVFPQTGPVVESLMKEVLRVARAVGITEDDLPESSVAETIQLTHNEYMEDPEGQRVPNDYKPSMLVDLECGRPMEVEAIVGGIVRSAKEQSVPTPQLDIVYASLRVMQRALVKDR